MRLRASRRSKDRWTGPALGLLAGLITALLALLQTFGGWERQLYDLRTALLADEGHWALQRVVVVGVDDAALGELGRWPWPRAVHAGLIDRLNAAGVHSIGFDFVFDMPDPDPAADQALVEAARRSGNVVFGSYGIFADQRTRDVLGAARAEAVREPLPELSAAADVASINVFADFDGRIRRVPLYIQVDGQPRLSLSAALAARAGVDLGAVPTGRLSTFPISYVGKGGTVPTYGYADVLAGRVDAAALTGRVVLVGPVDATFQDFVSTPFGPVMPGVEAHAQALITLLDGNVRHAAPWLWNFLAAPLLGLVIGAAAGRWHPAWALVSAVILAAAVFVAALVEMMLGRIWEISPLLLAVALSYVLVLGVRFLGERRRRARVQGLFSRYVDRKLVDQLVDLDQDELRLGGDRREVTVFFLDARGFTPLSERLAPEEVVARLNEAFEQITRIIFRHEGTLDKFMGDAVMAIWNAPLPVADHALKAVQAAWEIQTQVRVEDLSFGIGIATGVAVVGNIGSDERLEYTAIGDTVNTAARLESRAQPGEIYITEAVCDAMAGRIAAEPLGPMQVKGKSATVAVYKVTGPVVA